jgi:hypothetical protein
MEQLTHWRNELVACISLLEDNKTEGLSKFVSKAAHIHKYMDDFGKDLSHYLETAKAVKPPKEVIPEKIRFFDPHFHLFDSTSQGPSDPGLWNWLFPSAKSFHINEYEKMVLKDQDIELVGGMAIEATSVPGRRMEEAGWLNF